MYDEKTGMLGAAITMQLRYLLAGLANIELFDVGSRAMTDRDTFVRFDGLRVMSDSIEVKVMMIAPAQLKVRQKYFCNGATL